MCYKEGGWGLVRVPQNRWPPSELREIAAPGVAGCLYYGAHGCIAKSCVGEQPPRPAFSFVELFHW